MAIIENVQTNNGQRQMRQNNGIWGKPSSLLWMISRTQYQHRLLRYESALYGSSSFPWPLIDNRNIIKEGPIMNSNYTAARTIALTRATFSLTCHSFAASTKLSSTRSHYTGADVVTAVSRWELRADWRRLSARTQLACLKPDEVKWLINSDRASDARSTISTDWENITLCHASPRRFDFIIRCTY